MGLQTLPLSQSVVLHIERKMNIELHVLKECGMVMVRLEGKKSAPEHCSWCKRIVLLFTVVLVAQLLVTAE